VPLVAAVLSHFFLNSRLTGGRLWVAC